MKRNVAILLFDEVEVLDFAGPFEVFAVTNELQGESCFNVFTVAPTPGTVRARHGLKVVPDYPLERCPEAHVLVVPGGVGTRALLRQPLFLEWARQRVGAAEVVLSVCTGSLVLARIGALDGLRVTTHHEVLDLLRELAPSAQIDASQRFHDNPRTAARGRLITAAGISAGIDASLHVVASLLGEATAERTARYMEYGRYAQPTAGTP